MGLVARGALICGCILGSTGLLLALLLLVPELVASGLLAYSFGLRHAVDVDHIAAIDNTARRLTSAERRPLTVGLFFAMGHSLVVLLACLCILLAQGFMKDHLEIFQEYGGLIGTSISGTFLTIIGLLNLYTARQLWRAWKGDESCGHSHEILGVVTRCCPRLFEGIREPWHMLPVGFLFGLGFDTSSEVGLLGIVAVSHGLAQPAAVLLLPLLFMSGMCLLDTLNGFLMAWVYSTSLEDERPKLYFNLFLTSSSGLIALLIGCLELLSLCPRLWQLDGGFWALLQKANDNFELLGVVVISIFLVSLLLALACFRRVFRRRSDGAEALLRENVVRYVQSGDFIDRSGV
ncbi:unnamed protein product [Effrenium voratum]|uniref:Nickel/cobalt efflux system n=1 Tax=Effrenium voratum TaxID=2562239 RepID=A0AA36MWF2_9DINO|nr:unnamed protein product [Effrenium voratum]